MDDILGRVVAVSGSQIKAEVTANQVTEASIRISSMIKVRSAGLDVVGTISAAELDSQQSPGRIVLIVDLLGEIVSSAGALPLQQQPKSIWPRFIRGRQPRTSASGASTMMLPSRPLR